MPGLFFYEPDLIRTQVRFFFVLNFLGLFVLEQGGLEKIKIIADLTLFLRIQLDNHYYKGIP